MPTYIKKWVLLVVCALMVLYTFSGLANHAFELDDFRHLDDSRFVAQNLGSFFSPDKVHPGRPTMEAVFLIVWLIWDDNPAVFHVLSLVLHVVATLLLAWLFFRMSKNAELSLLGACLFLFNVAHFRTIHWIACLGFLLAFILGLISVLAFLRALENPSKKIQYVLISSIALVVGIGAHASIVSTFLFCIYLAWRQTRQTRQIVLLCLPQTCCALLAVVLLYYFYSQVPQAAHFEQLQDGKLLASFWHFIWLLGRLWTTAHWIFYNLDQVHLIDQVVGICILVGLIALIILQRTVSYWALWTLVSLLPFIAYPEQTWLLAGPSRYLYTASAGSSFVLAWLIYEGTSFLSRRYSSQIGRGVTIGVLICIIVLSMIAHERSEAVTFYLAGRNFFGRKNIPEGVAHMQKAVRQDAGIVKNDHALPNLVIGVSHSNGDAFLSLLESKLAQYPQILELKFLTGVAGFVHDDLSKQITGRHRIEETFRSPDHQTGITLALFGLANSFNNRVNLYHANRVYRLTQSLDPTHVGTLRILGYLLVGQDSLVQAERIYTQMVEGGFNDDKLRFDLAIALSKEQRYAEAIAHLQERATSDKSEIQRHYLLSQLYRTKGNLDTAYGHILQALDKNSEREDLWQELLDLGTLFHNNKDFDRALTIYKRVAQKHSKHQEVFLNLGILYFIQGEFKASVLAFERATQNTPRRWEVYHGLAQAYEQIGSVQDARENYKKVLTLNPDMQDAKRRLAVLKQTD